MEQIKRYSSVAALARDFEASGAVDCHIGNGDDWYGETAAESVRRAISGDTSRVAAAEKLLSQISAEIETIERPWIADVAGAYPVVPEFLAGQPDCMRRRAAVESDAAPVRIYFCPTISGDISAAAATARGVAVLALVLALSQSRPVELLIFSIVRRSGSKRESVIAAPVQTAPLDLATAAYALSSTGFVRRLCYQLARRHHFNSDCEHGLSWPAEYGTAGYLPDLLRRLGGDPAADLIIGPGVSGDPLIGNPVAWVNAQLARFGAVQ